VIAAALLLFVFGMLAMNVLGSPYRGVMNTADKVGAVMVLMSILIVIIVLVQTAWKYLP